MPMMTSSGSSSPADMYSWAFWPKAVPSFTAAAEHVAGGDVGHHEMARQTGALGALAGSLPAEHHESSTRDHGWRTLSAEL